MRIRMITLAASPERIMRPGEVVEMDTENALEMIRGGFAEAVGEALAARRSVAIAAAPERRGDAHEVALLQVPGIGEARAQALIDLGIMTAGELADGDVGAIAAAITGVGVATGRSSSLRPVRMRRRRW